MFLNLYKKKNYTQKIYIEHNMLAPPGSYILMYKGTYNHRIEGSIFVYHLMSHSAALKRFDQNEWESGESLVYIYLYKINWADFWKFLILPLIYIFE